jgi:Trm5-related predicted tRNA methylase
MIPKTYQLTLNFDQILDLVNQLPRNDKIRLSKELKKDTLDQTLTQLLETFKTDELSHLTITEEVENVRTEIYEQQSPH